MDAACYVVVRSLTSWQDLRPVRWTNHNAVISNMLNFSLNWTITEVLARINWRFSKHKNSAAASLVSHQLFGQALRRRFRYGLYGHVPAKVGALVKCPYRHFQQSQTNWGKSEMLGTSNCSMLLANCSTRSRVCNVNKQLWIWSGLYL